MDIYIPREIIRHILSYLILPTYMSTCRLFYEVDRELLGERREMILSRYKSSLDMIDNEDMDILSFSYYHNIMSDRDYHQYNILHTLYRQLNIEEFFYNDYRYDGILVRIEDIDLILCYPRLTRWFTRNMLYHPISIASITTPILGDDVDIDIRYSIRASLIFLHMNDMEDNIPLLIQRCVDVGMVLTDDDFFYSEDREYYYSICSK